MAILGIMIGVLALAATIWGVYYSRGQLREAQRIREENKTFGEREKKDDDLWAGKYVRAATLLCKIADTDRFPAVFYPRKIFYLGGTLTAVFSEDVCKQIVGQLIERQKDDSYVLRPMDTSQLRLKATRDLIDLVLVTLERFQAEKPKEAKELGL
jgi:hypothetical protein